MKTTDTDTKDKTETKLVKKPAKKSIIVDRHVDENTLVYRNSRFLLYKTVPKFSKFAMKIWFSLLAQIRPEDSEVYTRYTIDLVQMAELTGMSLHKVQEQARIASKSLLKHNVSFEQDDGSWLEVALISDAGYNSKTKKLTIGISEKFYPFLVNLRRFYDIKFPLGGPMRFVNITSYPLYEILVDYLGDSDQATCDFSEIEKMREMLYVEEDKYREKPKKSKKLLPDSLPLEEEKSLTDTKKSKTKIDWSQFDTSVTNFTRRVIEPCLEDINKFTPLSVSYEPITKWKKIVGFRIHMTVDPARKYLFASEAEQIPLFNGPDSQPTTEELIAKLELHKVAKSGIRKIIKSYGKNPLRIWSNIKYCEDRQSSIKTTMAAYIVAAIDNDYAEAYRIKEAEKRESAEQARLKAGRIQQELAEEREREWEKAKAESDIDYSLSVEQINAQLRAKLESD